MYLLPFFAFFFCSRPLVLAAKAIGSCIVLLLSNMTLFTIKKIAKKKKCSALVRSNHRTYLVMGSTNDAASMAQFAHKCILAHFSLVGTLVGRRPKTVIARRGIINYFRGVELRLSLGTTYFGAVYFVTG